MDAIKLDIYAEYPFHKLSDVWYVPDKEGVGTVIGEIEEYLKTITIIPGWELSISNIHKSPNSFTVPVYKINITNKSGKSFNLNSRLVNVINIATIKLGTISDASYHDIVQDIYSGDMTKIKTSIDNMLITFSDRANILQFDKQPEKRKGYLRS